ncbi:MAG: hypothetical protein E7047_09945 [Lentisphaerae bacterium]|nr:hypothetical protein [Lentisphaerota bacterium]
MKKIFIACVLGLACMLQLAADDGFGLGVWFDVPNRIGSKSIEGIGLGLPVIANSQTEGASLALCGNNVQKMEGFQFAWLGFNYARSLEGVQLAFVNMQRKQHGDFALQLGFYNQAGENGVQLGFLNNAHNNATFQLGLININKNGLLPIMIFVNFGRDLFD